MGSRVVYEVSLKVPAERSIELGGWLPGHIEEMLALPGFIEASTLDPVEQDNFRVHTVQYVLSDREALDRYLEEHAEQMRAPAQAMFGEDLAASRSIRDVIAVNDAGEHCLNCGVSLSGQYCWNCGQRGNTRLISVWELLRDAIGDMFELDSRLWRTMRPLAFKPGHLTAEYLRGRRAHYMPPFRMYLILSFLFFLVAQIGPFVTIDDDDTFVTADTSFDEDEADLVTINVDDPELEQQLLGAAAREYQAQQNCNMSDENMSVNIPFIDEDWARNQIRKLCKAAIRDGGRGLMDRAFQLSPVAALAMLPLLAFQLVILSPFKRRYYVEHLLMLVHFHSFIFLMFSLLSVVTWSIGKLAPAQGWLIAILSTVAVLWVIGYLYKTMRRVYGQNRFVTLFKFSSLIVGYLFSLILVMLMIILYVGATY